MELWRPLFLDFRPLVSWFLSLWYLGLVSRLFPTTLRNSIVVLKSRAFEALVLLPIAMKFVLIARRTIGLA